MAEDADLISDLDSLEVVKGPAPMTCVWWASASDEHRAAVTRNVARVGHHAVARKMRKANIKVTPPGIRDHAAGVCASCQTSPTS